MSSLKTNNISNLNGTLTIPTDTAIDLIDNGTAKAWVNFNGTGTVAIRAAYNVSSITDNGVGDYTINFTTAMPDANYVYLGTVSEQSGALGPNVFASNDPSTVLAGSFRAKTRQSSTALDMQSVSVAFFR